MALAQLKNLHELSGQLVSTVAVLIDSAEASGDEELRISAQEMMELATAVDDYIRRTQLELQSKPAEKGGT